jgi:hypothetical protein
MRTNNLSGPALADLYANGSEARWTYTTCFSGGPLDRKEGSRYPNPDRQLRYGSCTTQIIRQKPPRRRVLRPTRWELDGGKRSRPLKAALRTRRGRTASESRDGRHPTRRTTLYRFQQTPPALGWTASRLRQRQGKRRRTIRRPHSGNGATVSSPSWYYYLGAPIRRHSLYSRRPRRIRGDRRAPRVLPYS